MKCETPARESDSSREPPPIQKPERDRAHACDALADQPFAGRKRGELVLCTGRSYLPVPARFRCPEARRRMG